MKPKQSEASLQMNCIQWLDMQYKDILRTISPITRLSPHQGFKQKKLGYAKGSPDLIIFEPMQGYHGLLIEFKVGYNKQSPEQLLWEAKLKERGYNYQVIYTLEDFVSLIDWYLDD